MMGQIFINSKCDQSSKWQYIYLIDVGKKKIRRKKKCLPIFMKGWFKRDKTKCLATKSCVKSDIKRCQMPPHIKY